MLISHFLKTNSEFQNTSQKIITDCFSLDFFCLLERIIKILFMKENHPIVPQYIDWQIRINDLPCFSLLFAVITSRCYQNQRSIYLQSVLLLSLYVLVLGAENSQTPDFLIRVRGAAAEQGGWCVSQLFYGSRARRHFYGKIMRFGLIFGRMVIMKKKIGGKL